MKVPKSFKEWHCADYKLNKLTSFGAGGIGKSVFFPSELSQLKDIWVWANKQNQKPVVIGNGSNLLFSDGHFISPIICVKNINMVSVFENGISAQCGAVLPRLAKEAKNKSLSGFEFAVDIPATVGGSLMCNAGAYGSDVFAVLENFEYLDLDANVHTATASDCQPKYRYSGISKNHCIISASFSLAQKPIEEIEKKMKDNQLSRRKTQPPAKGTAGSIFKNPDGAQAWQLIEDCGLKGFREGQVGVSEKHANWIINYGGATSTEITNMIEFIRKTVFKSTTIKLEDEIHKFL